MLYVARNALLCYVSSDFIRKAITLSNPYLFSDLLCIIQCSRLRSVSAVNIICRIRTVKFICFFSVLVLFYIMRVFAIENKRYFGKLSKYKKMTLGKTSNSVTISENSYLNFLYMIIFRKL